MSRQCPSCQGRGKIIATPCPNCGGPGFTTQTRTLSVKIRAGMRTGMRLRLVGQGEPGEPGAARGDLFVVIVIEENTLFKLKRNNVLCEVPISFTQAALGGMIEVPTLRGKAKLKIPAGTQTGAILRMRGQGFPSLDGKHTGDQLVTVTVEIPACLTPAQQDTIQNLHEAGSLESYPQRRAFTERLRKWCEH